MRILFIFRFALLFGIIFIPISACLAQADTSNRPRVMAWGTNDAGQLGNGLKSSKANTPVWATEVEKILEPSFEILDIDAGVYTTCLLRSDKAVWCWGGGQTHDMSKSAPSVEKVEGLPPIISIEMGSGYTHCGKAEDKSIWCWEKRGQKARLIDYNVWKESASKLAEYQKLKYSFVDYYPGMKDACAVTDKGKLWCWGKTYSNNGKRHKSGQKYNISPIEIPLKKRPISVSLGLGQTCAIVSDQSAWCWGYATSPKPVRLFEDGEKIKEIFSGWRSGCALKGDGTVWCWRSLGNSFLNDSKRNVIKYKQIKISGNQPLTDIKKLDNQGNTLFCALRADSTVWCWGNTRGKPAQKNKKAIVQIKGPDGVSDVNNITDITVGAWSGYAVIQALSQK